LNLFAELATVTPWTRPGILMALWISMFHVTKTMGNQQ